MVLQEVLDEEGEPGPQQVGDEAGARMRKLIPGSSSSTLEFGRIRSNEPYDQSDVESSSDMLLAKPPQDGTATARSKCSCRRLQICYARDAITVSGTVWFSSLDQAREARASQRAHVCSIG